MLFNREQLIAVSFIVGFFIIGVIYKNCKTPLIKEPADYTLKEKLNGKADSQLSSIKKKEIISVEIKGAITKPGKYNVEKGTRYFDLIEMAGGFSKNADRNRVKKNYYLKNGYTFYVPFKRSSYKRKRKFKKPKWIEVEIRGAVKKPGVYKIKAGTRFIKLLRKAGGYNSRADRKKKYANYILKDGQSYFISFRR